MKAKIGDVQRVQAGGQSGYGFTVSGSGHSGQSLSIVYKTEAEAREARATVNHALSTAAFVVHAS